MRKLLDLDSFPDRDPWTDRSDKGRRPGHDQRFIRGNLLLSEHHHRTGSDDAAFLNGRSYAGLAVRVQDPLDHAMACIPQHLRDLEHAPAVTS